MSHRSSTWWRGLGAALFSLAALAWPAPAGAAATPSFTLVHQSPAAVLGRSSSAHLDVALRLAKPDRHAVVQLSLFSRLVTRVALDPLLNGVGPVGTATSTTGNFTLTCDTAKDVHLVVTLSSGPSSGSSRCASRAPRLRLPCRGASCDGVYPLEYAVTSGGVETTTWSLVAVRTLHVAAPLHADVIFTLDPSALAHSSAARATLRELSRHASVPLAITADYRTLESVLAGPADATRAWRDALNAGLASALHRAVVAPPALVDVAAVAAAGLRGQVASQLTLSSNLLRTLTGRYTDAPVVISGHPTSAGLAALGRAGARDAVIAETALATPPSTTLTWGAPFHVAGAPGVLALATDQGLDDLAANSSIAPGLRAVLTLDTLAFLHYEEPNAPAVRTEVLVVPAAQVDPTYVNDLLSGLTHDAFVTPESLTPSFNSTLVGSNGAAATQALGPATPSTWSSLNTFTLRRLAAMLTSYAAAIPHSPEADALRVALARAEVVGAPGPRQAGLERVSATLDAQLSLFSVDAGAITLTGPDTALPLTLYSHAGYAVNAVVHLVTDRMTFPGGADQPVSLDAPVKSLRVATAHHRGSSLILQVIVTTPNGRVTLARAAVPVRIAGASVVGYLLTGASLLVLALWWYRTHRSRSRGRHAR